MPKSTFTVYSVQFIFYSGQCTVDIVQCTVYSVQCTVYSVQCTVYSVQCTVYSVQCTVYIVQSPCLEVLQCQQLSLSSLAVNPGAGLNRLNRTHNTPPQKLTNVNISEIEFSSF